MSTCICILSAQQSISLCVLCFSYRPNQSSGCHTMFSWASLLIRRSSAFVHQRLPNQTLIIRGARASSQHSSSSSSTAFFAGFAYGDHNKSGDTLLKSSRLVSSGVVIAAASTLGYYSYRFSESNAKSFLCFADSPEETWAGDDSQLEQSIPAENNGKFLFGDSYRRRVFFNYEKRIRMQSAPEKVFEYFASYTTPSGDVLMTPADFMRAIVPVFPPSESNRIREGHLKGEKGPSELQCAPSKIFMLFDTNNDGLISFSEYIFFVQLLSIPESSFSIAFKMFDLDNNGEIDREEFKKVMNLMQADNKQGARHRNGRRLALKETKEDGGLVEYFFGKDGNACLKHENFVQFLRDLHNEILRLEFSHYDVKSRGTISAKDFALSLVAAADIGLTNKLLDRVDELNNEPQLNDVRITLQEFKDFAELRKKLQSLSLAIFTYGKVNGALTKQDFQRAASQVCGISITSNVVDIIFHVFDTNRDGNLSADEFVRVLQGRERESGAQPRECGFMGLLSCLSNCGSSKISSARLLL